MDSAQPDLKDLRTLNFEELTELMLSLGEKKFRAQQLWEWLWQKQVTSYERLTNLPKNLKLQLANKYHLTPLEIAHEQRSRDGSIKYGFRMFDGNIVEGVLIPSRDRSTACISSQVGCSLTCKFCATGYLKLKRNLFAYEIAEQVHILNRESLKELAQPLTNIVYMGMGEPLLNYKNVLESVERLTSPTGMGLSPRRITISTAGIAKMIRKLGDDGCKTEFALSLHAANDAKRNEMMPINETNNLEVLQDALKYFYQKTQTRVTFEYIIFHNFNDGLEDAKELSEFARCVPSKINVIEYNPIQEADFRNTTEERMNQFIGYLESRKHIVNVRRSRGKDVDGGCGQLALKVKEQYAS